MGLDADPFHLAGGWVLRELRPAPGRIDHRLGSEACIFGANAEPSVSLHGAHRHALLRFYPRSPGGAEESRIQLKAWDALCRRGNGKSYRVSVEEYSGRCYPRSRCFEIGRV